jgi:hypothetical protein
MSADTPKPLVDLVALARQASAHDGEIGSAGRHDAAKNMVRMPEPSASEFGAGRAALARAIRANVVALALTTDPGARKSVAYGTRELCNALLTEPAPPPVRPWWAQ